MIAELDDVETDPLLLEERETEIADALYEPEEPSEEEH